MKYLLTVYLPTGLVEIPCDKVAAEDYTVTARSSDDSIIATFYYNVMGWKVEELRHGD